MQVTLGRYIVTLKELYYWDSQEIQSIMMTGANMVNGQLSNFDGSALMKSKMATFEKTIVAIKEGEAGETFTFSQDWLKGLTIEEGEILQEAIDGLGKKK